MAARPQRRLPGLRSRRTGRRAGRRGARSVRAGRWPGASPRPLVGLLSGALFVVSAHSSEGTDLRPGRFTDLASMVRYDADAGRRPQARGVRPERADRPAQRLHRQQAGARGQPPGRRDDGIRPACSPQVGPGRHRDPVRRAPGRRRSSSPDNPNLLLVHQQDIQAVVNAMWKGGAQAITIQGQRVVSTTGIRCIGNSVQLQGVPYSQPYVISAVGDPAALTAAIARDPYLQVYRDDAADPDIAVGWDEQVEDKITAPAYDGLLGLSYAQVLPSSGASPRADPARRSARGRWLAEGRATCGRGRGGARGRRRRA